MGYSDNPNMVRATYFKLAGKYYTQEALDMSGCWDTLTTIEAVEKARGNHLPEMWCAVLEPYCRNPYPVLLPPIERRDPLSDPRIAQGLIRQFQIDNGWEPRILWCVGRTPYPGRIVMTWDEFVRLAWPSPLPRSS